MSRPSANTQQLDRARRAMFGTGSRFGTILRRTGARRLSPKYRGSRWLSAAILLLFVFQLLTGVLLSLYYNPGPEQAYTSTRFLVTQVGSGWLVRSLHHWAADLLVVAVIIHLAFTFFRRAYARPREFVWITGVFLLALTLGFRFTGRLLPWDEFGYEAGRRGLEMIATVPILGDLAATWLRGGNEFGATTLARFFTTHVLILPWLAFVIIWIHVHLVRAHGLKTEEDDG